MQNNYHMGMLATPTSLEKFGTDKLAHLIFIFIFLELILFTLTLYRWYLLRILRN